MIHIDPFPYATQPQNTPKIKLGPDTCKSLGQLRRQLLHLSAVLGVDLWQLEDGLVRVDHQVPYEIYEAIEIGKFMQFWA